MLKEIREQPDTVHDACRGRLRRAEGDRAVRRPEPDAPPAPPRPPHRLRRLRHELARGPGRRVPDRAAGAPAGRGRVRQRVPLPQRPARRPHAGLRPEPVGRDRRHPGRAPRGEAARATRPWRSSTPSAARSPARPTAASTSTPGPRSASPAPRRSRRRSPCLTLLALYFGRLRHLSFPDGLAVVDAIEARPRVARPGPARDRAADHRGRRAARAARSALYLGRDLHFPVALEGALKLKEISYIHAEGYPTAEMKHGPIALIDRETPSRLRRPARLAPRQDPEQRRGGPRPARHDHRRRHRGRRRARRAVRRLPADPRRPRGRPAAPGRRPAPAPGLPRRPHPRLRHRQAAEPRQERDRRVTSIIYARNPLSQSSSHSGSARTIPARLAKRGSAVACVLTWCVGVRYV